VSDIVVKNPVIEEIAKISFEESEFESLKDLVGNIKTELTCQKSQMEEIEREKNAYDSKGSIKKFFSGGQLKKTMQEAVFLQNRSAQTQIDMLFLLMIISKEIHTAQTILAEQQRGLTKNTGDIASQQSELNKNRTSIDDLRSIFTKISDRFKSIEDKLAGKKDIETVQIKETLHDKSGKQLKLFTVLVLMAIQTIAIVSLVLFYGRG